MKNIAIVVQRYGLEVNGGAEYHARILAEKLNLNPEYDITILTTKSLNHLSWKNYYEKNSEIIHNIKVKRFDVDTTNHKKTRFYQKIILHKRLYHKFLKAVGLFHFLQNKYGKFVVTEQNGNDFILAQGPYCPTLVEYIKENKNRYDVFIFFTYLYYPTVFGMKEVGEKSIFIPTAHDEPMLYTKPFENLFAVPKFIMYNTISEKKLVENYFENTCKNTAVAGVGIDEYTVNNKISDKFKYDTDYFIYIGRVEANKCNKLIRFFERYAKQNKNIKLILVGKKSIKYQKRKNKKIVFTGFVSESEKYYLLQNAKALIIPSKYESLSLVTLESMLHKKIVIANARCEVLKNHIEKSQTGFLFDDYPTFAQALNNVLDLSAEAYEIQSKNAKEYVTQNYSWESILQKFDRAINFVTTLP